MNKAINYFIKLEDGTLQEIEFCNSTHKLANNLLKLAMEKKGMRFITRNKIEFILTFYSKVENYYDILAKMADEICSAYPIFLQRRPLNTRSAKQIRYILENSLEELLDEYVNELKS